MRRVGRGQSILSALILLSIIVAGRRGASTVTAEERDSGAAVNSPRRVLDFDPDWTPRPQKGDVPDYVKETDEHWIDPRLRAMDTGRTWNATFRYPDAGRVDKDGQPVMHRSFKGTAIRIGDEGEAAIIFDRNQLRWACAWTGDFLSHSDRRFALLNTPQPAGDVQFATSPGAGWSRADGEWPESPSATGPLPRDWAHFEGMHRHGDRTILSYTVGETGRVLEMPWIEHREEFDIFTRTFVIEGLEHPSEVLLWTTSRGSTSPQTDSDVIDFQTRHGGAETYCQPVAAIRAGETFEYRIAARVVDEEARIVLQLPTIKFPTVIKVSTYLNKNEGDALPLTTRVRRVHDSPGLLRDFIRARLDAGPSQWPERIVTRGSIAPNDAPYVIDTIGVPFENPYKALMFLSGVDFLGDDVYVSTVHGDVWKLTGMDDDLDEVVWKRYATGLYQPLGLKVVDGKVLVLERGQLTRLHDLNGDGEADFYESFNADWYVGGGEHSFDTCLETDPEGNFYFHSTGDPHVPTGGTLMKVSADGQRSEVFSTGFRHPIGLGVLPDGRITGADQEGNWMPSTRIDIYRKGGFYGDFRCHHCETPPELYDGPLCWLPRQMDGSAGGQVAVPPEHWGPLGGRYLHMSFGRCRMMLLMMQQLGEIEQAGAVDLGLQFESGIQRGRFRPNDGHLYVVGMDGWQTAAVVDGCLQRVRHTGQSWMSPTDLAIEPGGIRLTFSEPLDRDVAANPERYHIEQWNYRWSGEYGSARYSVSNLDAEGQDVVPIQTATVREDGRQVFLTVPNIKPVMQMQIDYRLVDKQGQPVEGVVYNTIHTTGE
ncbi:MAG: hypothetical protein KF861_14740 [Planctomycetaceae bacterium]|nr:hypothetical protein [Planctomycetaceae bacterium]